MAKGSSSIFDNTSEAHNLDSHSFRHNNAIIEQLHENDFVYLEKDLEFHDKVSLMFLLYGDKPLNAKIGLQKLRVLYQGQCSQTTDIQQWILSKNAPNWRLTIIEALWTIKAKYVLQKLGLYTEDLYVRFLNPSNAEVNLYIHPILKGLYCMCEKLNPNEAKQLINYVNSNGREHYPIDFTDEKYLEFFLLHWLSERVIDAGEWSLVKSERNVFSNLDVIFEFLNSNKPAVEEDLRRIVVRFNFTSNNLTSIERKANVTDHDGYDHERTDKLSTRNHNGQLNKPQNGSDDRYVVERDTAGFVLIINQINFYRDPVRKQNLPLKPLESRHGTDKDEMALRQTFSAVGYKPVVKINLTDVEIIEEVEDIVTKSGTSDSLIVCILSHGSEGVIYGSNSVPVKIKNIQDIIVSKQLLDKPKILILQSCQGDELQIAQPVEENSNDSKNLAIDGPSNKTIPMHSDFCVAKSTISGFSSIRHVKDGAWFIQTLCKTIDAESHRKHFVDIMTMVKNQVTKQRGGSGECMVPICEDAFTKYFYFPPRIE